MMNDTKGNIKILSIIGSNNPNSISARFNNLFILDKFAMVNYESECLLLGNFNVKFCTGCLTCFNSGVCPLDNSDDMKYIKQKILFSDVLIIVSPVYANNVSGILKNLLDRLAFWSHLMLLNGKMSFVIAVTHISGWQFVQNYLERFFTCCGANIVNKYNYCSRKFDNEKELMDYIRGFPSIPMPINYYLNLSNPLLEDYFTYMKNQFYYLDEEILHKSQKNEIRHWVDTGKYLYGSYDKWIRDNKHV